MRVPRVMGFVVLQGVLLEDVGNNSAAQTQKPIPVAHAPYLCEQAASGGGGGACARPRAFPWWRENWPEVRGAWRISALAHTAPRP